MDERWLIAFFFAVGAIWSILALDTIKDIYIAIRRRIIYKAFRRAFEEWANIADYQGYREIPETMYADLVGRLETALHDTGG